MVEKKAFGRLGDGRMVSLYRITNQYGEYVSLLDYGATIYEIIVRDRNGQLGDVVLGAPGADSLETFPFMGSTIGRCANRIANGRYEADGIQYQLEQNMGKHFLHGGSGNYAKKLFSGSVDEALQSVTFYYKDTGEGGFTCDADAYVTFRFDEEARLSIIYDWSGEDTTILNPTNHSYFNLAGTKDARGQKLRICSGNRVSRDEDGIPDGGEIPVKGTAADFEQMWSICQAMESDNTGYFEDAVKLYDEVYVMNDKTSRPAAQAASQSEADPQKNRPFRLLAELSSPETGRTLHVYSDMPSLVLFLIPIEPGVTGKHGQVYEGYCGVCLETGFVPNAVNCPQFDSPLFHKGEQLHSVTVYQFGTEC
ncbi:MAG: galactose mutarotase [Lachnospiraceae bacterium]|nr:galactose mutarotase [Lachnospiraceae bacterium]